MVVQHRPHDVSSISFSSLQRFHSIIKLNKKTRGVAINIYSRKTLEKPKTGMRILKIRVWELFMHGEGISTPCTHHKG